MTFRNVNFPTSDLMRVSHGVQAVHNHHGVQAVRNNHSVQAVRNPKSIIRAWRRSWLYRLLTQKGEP